MLRATSSRVGLLSVRYEVRASGHPVTDWTARHWQQHRDLLIEGSPYALRSEGIARFGLEGDVRARCLRSADGPPSQRYWNLEAGEVRYRLAGSGVGRRFALLTPADAVNEAGRIWRIGTLRPSYAAELPGALPMPVQVFVLWIAMAIWRASVAAARATLATTAGQ